MEKDILDRLTREDLICIIAAMNDVVLASYDNLGHTKEDSDMMITVGKIAHDIWEGRNYELPKLK